MNELLKQCTWIFGRLRKKVFAEKCSVCGKSPCYYVWDDGDGVFYFCSRKCMKYAKDVTVPR